jgi:hypothetical protein
MEYTDVTMAISLILMIVLLTIILGGRKKERQKQEVMQKVSEHLFLARKHIKEYKFNMAEDDCIRIKYYFRKFVPLELLKSLDALDGCLDLDVVYYGKEEVCWQCLLAIEEVNRVLREYYPRLGWASEKPERPV